MPTSIFDSIQYLKSIGPKRAESFHALGIKTIYDLLFYFPTKHLDRSNIINSAKVIRYTSNGFDGEVTITGKVIEKETVRYGKKQIFKVHFQDDVGTFECVWFQGIKFFKKKFNAGEFYAISAKPVITRYGHLQFTHPDFDQITDEESEQFINTGKIIPVYKKPQALRANNIGDLGLRKVILLALEKFGNQLSDTLPKHIVESNNLLNLRPAVENMHFPTSQAMLEKAKTRFKYEELFYIESLVALKRNNYKSKVSGITFATKVEMLKSFRKKLPFELTRSQDKVLSEILSDMNNLEPMNRLLQGDVGSGKTIVALISMLNAVFNGYQAVIMAPTEILANQHHKNITNLLEQSNIRTDILIGSKTKKEREKLLNELESGTTQILVGTHAIFEDPVIFNKLGLVVIDEQHRFGVIQKSKLVNKGIKPDVLVMTATPIPRALTLTVYGDLDVSIINELPKNRKAIRTAIRHDNKLPDIYKFIIDKVNEGYQSFIVYPLVEESEKIELKAAEEYYETLKNTYFTDLRVGLLHGKMHWRDKEEVMLQFANNKYDVLIATTVIEVGIDVPNANIIVINDANRFGLSQLHQLRGRVGRGTEQAYCILVSSVDRPKLSSNFNFDFSYLSKDEIEKNKSRIRMSALERFSSGFELSEIDLKLRGPGDIFGTKQSGFPEFKHANIIEDRDILIKAKADAFQIIKEDQTLSKQENKIIRDVLKKHYSQSIKYSQIA